MASISLGIIQFQPSDKVNDNLATMSTFLQESHDKGVDLAVFPEFCTCVAGLSATKASVRPASDWQDILGSIAAKSNTAVIFGGVPTLLESGFIRNRAYVFNADGVLITHYDKSHLFTMHARTQDAMDEQALFTTGQEPVSFNFKGLNIGLSICYDLRYSDLYLNYRKCDLVICTAAFTEMTGEAHWNTLLRARAIENQFWFAGADLCNENRQAASSLYGHSAIYDPWGNLVAFADHNHTELITAEINTDAVIRTRKKMPMLF